jgi:DNA-binding NarL/FixJ family response regulator
LFKIPAVSQQRAPATERLARIAALPRNRTEAPDPPPPQTQTPRTPRLFFCPRRLTHDAGQLQPVPDMLAFARKDHARIVVGDDHPLFRDALAQLATSMFADAMVETAATMGEVIQLAETGHPPDLFLLDLLFPGMDIATTLPELRRRHPRASIILISMVDDEATIALALRSGGDGFINKAVPRERCIQAINRVLAGEYVVECEDAGSAGMGQLGDTGISLTARQRAVLDMLADNAPNKVIARDLGISHLTVRLHVSALLRILGVNRRSDVASKARMLGLLDPE